MKVFGLQFDKQNIQNSNRVQASVTKIFEDIARDLARVVSSSNIKLDGDKPFRIEDHPILKRPFEVRRDNFIRQLIEEVNKGTKKQWELANVKNDALVDFFKGNTKIPAKLLDKWNNHNMEALKVFQSRKTDGRNLSDRVWETAEAMKGNLGMAIDIALSDGRSANELSRDVRQYLLEPDKLFRRVRDEHGGLHLSQEAEKYSPGPGVYRSSYKNAMRLARTEINSAYRTADNERIQKLDFVVGIEIRRSNRVFECDVCNSLVGKYPKDFVFTGWHPQCRCFVLSILSTKDEFVDQMKNLLEGKETDVDSENTVYDTPPNFKKWVADNADSIEASKEKGTTPFWMQDNKNAVHRALNEGRIKRKAEENRIGLEEERKQKQERVVETLKRYEKEEIFIARIGNVSAEDIYILTDGKGVDGLRAELAEVYAIRESKENTKSFKELGGTEIHNAILKLEALESQIKREEAILGRKVTLEEYMSGSWKKEVTKEWRKGLKDAYNLPKSKEGEIDKDFIKAIESNSNLRVENIDVSTVVNSRTKEDFKSSINGLFYEYDIEAKNNKDTPIKLSFRGGADYDALVESRAEGTINKIDFGVGTHRNQVNPADAIRVQGRSYLASTDMGKGHLGTLYHEFAHIMWADFRTERSAFSVALEDIRREYEAEVKSLVSQGGAEYSSNPEKQKARKRLDKIWISPYAHTNVDEFFAEGFMEYKLRSTTPSEYSVRIGKLVDKHFKKY